ncbi:MAG: hypothetical protein Q8M29_12200 [Bacteroidota bacterium]|nr:hypothetical protein [Bacteroidota bacterium]
MKKIFLFSLVLVISLVSCKKKTIEEEDDHTHTAPRLIFKFKFDSTQVRLNDSGQVSLLPSNHGAQCPKFNKMSAHYIEISGDFDSVGKGKVLYRAPEVTTGGSLAIDFNQSVRVGDGQEFFSIPLSQVSAGIYKWLRVSVAYQNYDIVYKNTVIPSGFGTGTIASFIGFNTYITSYTIKNQSQAINANKLQGYWGFETTVLGTSYVSTGQAPPGATTVPNPNLANSPIPAGSCLVTGQFKAANGANAPLIIQGTEEHDIIVTVSLSTNNSFEWVEHGGDSYFEPVNATNPLVQDTVVDMGIRGMVPKWE